MTDKELTDANFELEQDIMKCWNVVDDIRDVVKDFENGHVDHAGMVQALRAFADVYANRFDRTFRRYETVCRGLYNLRAQVIRFESAQMAGPKSGKMGKSKKQKPVDTKSESC